MHDTEGLRQDKNGGSVYCLRLHKNSKIQAKSNLESDYLIVQFIYEFGRAKGISYIVPGQRGWAQGTYSRE